MLNKITIEQVLNFWFTKPISDHWFSSTPAIDQLITDGYESIWEQAKAGELNTWKESPDGCLALCIILDQMPLNMFRGTAKSFSTEQQAVEITKHAIKEGFDTEVPNDNVSFLYMPLMHSENLDNQKLAVQCFEKAKLEGNVKFAKHHRGIIEKYGRFPHRNEALGRVSSQVEMDYLNSDKAFMG
ncbi:MAG: DUF924 domain-containing protein [Cocleimonas sp.]|nr:DUF924 domain-containing protein [Cocleimonas sp.]